MNVKPNVTRFFSLSSALRNSHRLDAFFGFPLCLVRVSATSLLCAEERWLWVPAFHCGALGGWGGGFPRAWVFWPPTLLVCLCPLPLKVQPFAKNLFGDRQLTVSSPGLFFNILRIVAQLRNKQVPRHKSPALIPSHVTQPGSLARA